MEYRRLGSTGMKVSEICLGTHQFGAKPGEEDCIKIVHRALDLGINFFDTADVYGAKPGMAEEILGKALKGHRDEVVIATKCFVSMSQRINDRGSSRYHIIRACDASLKRLGVDYIDLYQMHRWDDETPIEETVRTLDDLVRWGKVLYVGASNYAAWQLAKALWVQDKLGLARFESLQPSYSLINRAIEREHIPLCKDQGVGIICYSPLGGGFLTGKYKPGEPPPQGARYGEESVKSLMTPQNVRLLEVLSEIARERGKTMGQIALAWVLRDSVVSSAIMTATRPEQVEDNAGASGIKLSEEELKKIEAVFQ